MESFGISEYETNLDKRIFNPFDAQTNLENLHMSRKSRRPPSSAIGGFTMKKGSSSTGAANPQNAGAGASGGSKSLWDSHQKTTVSSAEIFHAYSRDDKTRSKKFFGS